MFINRLALLAAILFSSASAAVPPADATPLERILQGVVNGLGAGDIDVATCVQDLKGAEENVANAVVKFRAHANGEAMNLLGSAMHDAAIAVTPCQVAELPSRLDQLAAALHLSQVKWVDQAFQIWVAGAQKEQEIEGMISSWEKKDYDGFSKELSTFLGELGNMLNCKPEDSACLMLQSILMKSSKVIIQDFEPCIAAVTPLAVDLENAEAAYQAGELQDAIKDLVAFGQGLSSAVAPCHLRDLSSLFATTSSKLAKATVVSSSGAIKYGPIDITKDVIDLIKSIQAKNWSQAGIDISNLLAILRSDECTSEMCNVVEGLLQAMGIIAYDMGDCKTSLESAKSDFDDAVNSFKNQQWSSSLVSLEKGFGLVAKGVHSCQLDAIGTLIDQEGTKFGVAIPKVVDSTISIIVEGADIFAPLDAAIQAFENKNYNAAGAALGDLTNVLRRTACKDDDKACIIIEGLLQETSIVLSDLGMCSTELQTSVNDIEAALADFKAKNYKQGITDLANGLHLLANGVRDCHLDELADVIVAQASKLGLADVQVLDTIVHVLVEGADVYNDVYEAANAYEAGDYASAGRALSALLQDTKLASCKTPICEILTAAIQAISTIAPDLEACESDLEAAYADFEMIGTSIKAGDNMGALKALSRGLEEVAVGVKPCNLANEGVILANVAQELGFNSISKDISGVITIVVAGADIYDNLFQAGNCIEGKDYKCAGDALSRVIQDIMKWHYKNGCDSPMCFILEGMTKAFNIIESDFSECEAEISASVQKFEDAITAFKGHKSFADSSKGEVHGIKWNAQVSTPQQVPLDWIPSPRSSPIELAVERRVLRSNARRLSWWTNITSSFKKIVDVIEDDIKTDWNSLVSKLQHLEGDDNVKEGLADLAAAFDDVAKSLSACHAAELAEVIEKLVVALGAPEYGWLTTTFNIIINGAQLYDDAYNCVVDYEAKNYIGAGYEFAKFAILVVKDI
jgi:hypothetical protein